MKYQESYQGTGKGKIYFTLHAISQEDIAVWLVDDSKEDGVRKLILYTDYIVELVNEKPYKGGYIIFTDTVTAADRLLKIYIAYDKPMKQPESFVYKKQDFSFITPPPIFVPSNITDDLAPQVLLYGGTTWVSADSSTITYNDWDYIRGDLNNRMKGANNEPYSQIVNDPMYANFFSFYGNIIIPALNDKISQIDAVLIAMNDYATANNIPGYTPIQTGITHNDLLGADREGGEATVNAAYAILKAWYDSNTADTNALRAAIANVYNFKTYIPNNNISIPVIVENVYEYKQAGSYNYVPKPGTIKIRVRLGGAGGVGQKPQEGYNGGYMAQATADGNTTFGGTDYSNCIAFASHGANGRLSNPSETNRPPQSPPPNGGTGQKGNLWNDTICSLIEIQNGQSGNPNTFGGQGAGPGGTTGSAGGTWVSNTPDQSVNAYSGKDGSESNGAGGGGCGCSLPFGPLVTHAGPGGGGGGFIEFEINDLSSFASGIAMRVGKTTVDLPSDLMPNRLFTFYNFPQNFSAWAYWIYGAGGVGYIRIIETVKTLIPGR